MFLKRDHSLRIGHGAPMILLALMAALFLLGGCSGSDSRADLPPEDGTHLDAADASSGQIFLYGEQHSVERILQEEFQLWDTYYHEEDMRHLFVELPYYTAEFLNLWMQSDNNDILDQLYLDWEGTAIHSPDAIDFYKQIKRDCPETIFHGTDVGHQYNTTGERYLAYLRENGQSDGSEQYLLAQEAIEQGQYYYQHSDDVYRENTIDLFGNLVKEEEVC